MSEPKKIRIAVVGCGVGREHVQALTELAEWFEIVAVCDLDANKARAVASEFGVARVYTDYAELCRRDDLDVIDLATPPFLHYAQVLEGLAAGKHVICEKPLVGSLKELDELKLAQEKAGRILMPIFQYRFGHGLQKLKLLKEQGLTGPAYLSTVETAWRRRADYYSVPWRGKWQTEIGGTLTGHALHTHDMLTYILGPAKTVFARMNTRVNPVQVEDCASVSLEMADGSLASLSATVGSAVQISRHRFCFGNLTAESNTRPYSNSGDPWVFTVDSPEAQARIDAALAQFEPLPEGKGGQFYRFAVAFNNGTALPVTLDDARRSLELLTAIYYSAYTGQNVAFPIANDHPFYGGWAKYFS